jgi:hypothetical protein
MFGSVWKQDLEPVWEELALFRVPDLNTFGAFWWPNLVPRLGTQSGNFFTFLNRFWGPDLVPFLDPKNGPQKWSPIKK